MSPALSWYSLRALVLVLVLSCSSIFALYRNPIVLTVVLRVIISPYPRSQTFDLDLYQLFALHQLQALTVFTDLAIARALTPTDRL